MTTSDELDGYRIVDAPLPGSLSGLREWGELELDEMGATPPKGDGVYVGERLLTRPQRPRC